MALISELREEYKGEWLAIRVIREAPWGPEAGELLYHAREVREVWQKISGDRRSIYVTYAGPALQEGYGAAF